MPQVLKQELPEMFHSGLWVEIMKTHLSTSFSQPLSHTRARTCACTDTHTFRFLWHIRSQSLQNCLGSLVLLLSPFFGSHHFPELWELGTDRTLVSAYASHLVTAKCPLKVTVVFTLGQWMVPFNGTNLHSTYSSVQGPELIPTLCLPWPSHCLK